MTRDEALAILGVSENATHEQVQAAFEKRARIVHPDTGGDACQSQGPESAKGTPSCDELSVLLSGNG